MDELSTVLRRHWCRALLAAACLFDSGFETRELIYRAAAVAFDADTEKRNLQDLDVVEFNGREANHRSSFGCIAWHGRLPTLVILIAGPFKVDATAAVCVLGCRS